MYYQDSNPVIACHTYHTWEKHFLPGNDQKNDIAILFRNTKKSEKHSTSNALALFI